MPTSGESENSDKVEFPLKACINEKIEPRLKEETPEKRSRGDPAPSIHEKVKEHPKEDTSVRICGIEEKTKDEVMEPKEKGLSIETHDPRLSKVISRNPRL